MACTSSAELPGGPALQVAVLAQNAKRRAGTQLSGSGWRSFYRRAWQTIRAKFWRLTCVAPDMQVVATVEHSASLFLFDWQDPAPRLHTMLAGHIGNVTAASTCAALPHTLASGSGELLGRAHASQALDRLRAVAPIAHGHHKLQVERSLTSCPQMMAWCECGTCAPPPAPTC